MLVFSDLDGTLLDHETYRWDAAQQALDTLHNLGICIVLASSKTAAELVPLREAMGLSHCEAIVENGAGILEPVSEENHCEDTAQITSGRYQALLDRLEAIPQSLRRHFTGFSNWSVGEVRGHTGLDEKAAQAAKQRQFSEPGIWSGTENDRKAFIDALQTSGIVAIQGGRFLTLSFGGNKADRLKEIAGRYVAKGKAPYTIALGDAPNDVAMLEAADMGIIIPNPGGAGIAPLPGEADGHIIRAVQNGPAGWSAAMLQVIRRLQDGKETDG